MIPQLGLTVTYVPGVAGGGGPRATALRRVSGAPLPDLYGVHDLCLGDCRGRPTTAGGGTMITIT